MKGTLAMYMEALLTRLTGLESKRGMSERRGRGKKEEEEEVKERGRSK